MITAGNQALFQHGAGCGACYQVSCSNPQCSGNPITVALTDECPGKCNNDPVHFDLSGTAFGAMAKPGQADQLRKLGRINISYKRVACNYKQNIMFKVDKGSNPNFFAVATEAGNGDGELSLVEIKPTGSDKWFPMQRMFGATWSANINIGTQKPPFSLQLTSGNKHQITADNVIPAGWQPRAIYKSNVSCSNPQCSGNPITVALTDECPGKCNNDPVHFDLSGTAFGAMAKPGQADQLRKLGRINISYKRVACNYKQNIMFKVDKGSNPNFFAVATEAGNGDGELSLVEIKPTGSDKWFPMQRMFGATWSANINIGTQKPPFSLQLTSGNKHQVSCSNPQCSGNPITVALTDECPGKCNNDPVHFDLSGTAFGAMAKPGQADQLRKLGRINISYKRVACNYKQNIMFKVDKGSNPNFFAVATEAGNGDGELSLVEIKPTGSDKWFPMQRMFGATWSANINIGTQKPPFSLQLTSGNKHQITADNVIPAGWQPRAIYKSNVSCSNPQCSGNPITVALTDECPGKCNNDPVHFDLSGTAFGAMAKPGQADQLRKLGRINISYKRVACNYKQNIMFKVDKGSNPNFFAVATEAENGDGELSLVEIKPTGADKWFPMQRMFGATWSANINIGTQKPPFSLQLTSGNKHQVLCNGNQECSGKLITVALTDECPGTCNDDPVHFDLSGFAFGAMSKSGQADQLRKLGRIDIYYKRVACDYKQNIMFKVEKGSNPNFLAVAIEAENGDGELSLVEIKPASSDKWLSMQQMFGATWSANIYPDTQKPPFSIRLTSQNKHQVQADNVIPVDWQPRAIYKSNINFSPEL
ncbi:hypothetical protein K7X08_030402 [Anisodus acutangulus]|uniref:Uncharacterized protein n=1 Tax=Anisodus acutangulus TaxID=402998 RepID=A0A9Q1LNX8_9SOLA|nr:hypothetical protein K7X08_030402 [Anisodus acutangulus]